MHAREGSQKLDENMRASGGGLSVCFVKRVSAQLKRHTAAKRAETEVDDPMAQNTASGGGVSVCLYFCCFFVKRVSARFKRHTAAKCAETEVDVQIAVSKIAQKTQHPQHAKRIHNQKKTTHFLISRGTLETPPQGTIVGVGALSVTPPWRCRWRCR